MKILRLKENITVILNDGTMLTDNNCTDELHNDILAHQTDEEYVQKLLSPKLQEKVEEIKKVEETLEEIKKSKYLSIFGNSVYMKSVSELTMPEDLIKAFNKAEKEGNQELINTYINFWTLASTNPDSRARHNLFWFLNKYGMTISKSGLFVAFRNVAVKNEGSEISSKLAKRISKAYAKVKMKWKKNPKNFYLIKDKDGEVRPIDGHSVVDGMCKNYGNLKELYNKLNDENVAPVYTDQHSGKFTIKIGEVVSMPREECDSRQDQTCSRGLHVAGQSWLSQGYFGDTPLMVLVNPGDVIAVPPTDNYGKMRTCAYYPVQVVDFKDGEIVNPELEDGFEDDFINKIISSTTINNEDNSNYQLTVPNIPELSMKNIVGRLDIIKKQLESRDAN